MIVIRPSESNGITSLINCFLILILKTAHLSTNNQVNIYLHPRFVSIQRNVEVEARTSLGFNNARIPAVSRLKYPYEQDLSYPRTFPLMSNPRFTIHSIS